MPSIPPTCNFFQLSGFFCDLCTSPVICEVLVSSLLEMFNSLLLHISCYVLIRTHFPIMSLQFFLSFISSFRELPTYTSDKGFLFIFFRYISPDDQLLLSLLVFDSFFDHFRAPCSRFFSYFSRSPVSVSCLFGFFGVRHHSRNLFNTITDFRNSIFASSLLVSIPSISFFFSSQGDDSTHHLPV